jgi:hypothetical protein
LRHTAASLAVSGRECQSGATDAGPRQGQHDAARIRRPVR